MLEMLDLALDLNGIHGIPMKVRNYEWIMSERELLNPPLLAQHFCWQRMVLRGS